MAWISAAAGFAPSVQQLFEQKLYRIVSVPLGVMLRIVHRRWPRQR